MSAARVSISYQWQPSPKRSGGSEVAKRLDCGRFTGALNAGQSEQEATKATEAKRR